MTGSVRCQATSSTPASDVGSTSSEESPKTGKIPGNGPMPTAKVTMSSSPSHHSGIE